MSQSQYVRLARSDDRTLDSIFATAAPPAFETLAGFQWRGYNTDPNLRVLGLRKFIKTFFRGRNGDEGCNIKVEQNRLSEPWIARQRNGGIDAFAFYLVGQQTSRTRLDRNPNALLIDYAASPRNPAWHVERLIRDYVVQPFADNPDLMIGRAYLGIGRACFASSYFVIERLMPLPADIPRDRWDPSPTTPAIRDRRCVVAGVRPESGRLLDPALAATTSSGVQASPENSLTLIAVS